MTYQEALKARARLAYSQYKTATTDKSPNAQITMAAAKAEGARQDMQAAQKAVDDEAAAVRKADEDLAASQEQGRKDKIISHYGYGSGLGGVTMEDEMNYDDRNRKGLAEQARIDAARLAKRNLGIGAGAGALAGLGTAGAAYGLAGLFPSLKKRRLLRALVALSAGGAAGLGVGYGVNAGLNSGKIQGAYGTAKSRGLAALDALKGGQAQA